MIKIRINQVQAYLSFFNVSILEKAFTIVSWIASAQSWSLNKIVFAVEYNCLSESRIRNPSCSLKEELRLPVILYYIEDFSVKEIAQILEISEGAVQKRLARARGKLRQELQEVSI